MKREIDFDLGFRTIILCVCLTALVADPVHAYIEVTSEGRANTK